MEAYYLIPHFLPLPNPFKPLYTTLRHLPTVAPTAVHKQKNVSLGHVLPFFATTRFAPPVSHSATACLLDQLAVHTLLVRVLYYTPPLSRTPLVRVLEYSLRNTARLLHPPTAFQHTPECFGGAVVSRCIAYLSQTTIKPKAGREESVDTVAECVQAGREGHRFISGS